MIEIATSIAKKNQVRIRNFIMVASLPVKQNWNCSLRQSKQLVCRDERARADTAITLAYSKFSENHPHNKE